ncbi:phosphodiesterase [Mycolicibacterium poriferae]|uniref:phosphodiesterase n=2 Tax=Mycolicibacterium poriferae TaxID=39694 RepID=UPI0024BAE5C8|nr:phosphodiesterase [Mycolicibacterium poriferae]
MKASDLVGVPIEWGAALRDRRLFHPRGVLADGRIERVAPHDEGLPVPSGPVVGRLSKAVGVPGSLPDAAGLAWRMFAGPSGDSPWDVLLVTAGVGDAAAVPNRLLLRPVAAWANTRYSSLMPLAYRGQLWWVRARMVTDLAADGLDLDAVVDTLDRSEIEFDIEQACGSGDFRPLATLRLSQVRPVTTPDQDVSFDPVRNTAPGVCVWPQWLRNFRRLAYRRSREGRDRPATP